MGRNFSWLKKQRAKIIPRYMRYITALGTQ